MVNFVASVEQTGNDPVMDLVCCLLQGVTDTHIMHWTTNSYSEHQALGEFYDSLSDLTDQWVEAFMGKYGVLTQFPAVMSSESAKPILYLKAKRDKITEYRYAPKFPKDSELQNIIDEIVAQIDTTLYKLTRLK